MLTDKDLAFLLSLGERAPKYPHEEMELKRITQRVYNAWMSRQEEDGAASGQNGSVPPEQDRQEQTEHQVDGR